MTAITRPSARQGYLAAFGTITIWIGFMLVSRWGGKAGLTSWDMVALRLGTAALVIAPFCLKWSASTWRNPKLWFLSLVGGALFMSLVYAGLARAPAAHGGVFASGTQPFLITLLAWALLGAKPHPQRILGVLAIGAGILCAAAPQMFIHQSSESTWRGDLLLFSAALAWSVYSVLVRKWQFDGWLLTRFVVIGSALVYLPIYAFWLPQNISQVSLTVVLTQAFYQGILATIVAMLLFLRAVSILGPERNGALVAVVPVMVGLLAVPLLDEPLTPWLLIGAALASFGAYWASRPLKSATA